MKKTNQRSCTQFLGKYGGLYLYSIYLKNRYTIDQEEILLVKKYGCDLIGNPDHPDGTSTYHKYFSFMMTSLTKF